MEYGYYIVGKGVHKGKVVYYDDDESEKTGYFYLGAFRDGFIQLPFSSIERPASARQIQLHEKAGKSIAQY